MPDEGPAHHFQYSCRVGFSCWVEMVRNGGTEKRLACSKAPRKNTKSIVGVLIVIPPQIGFYSCSPSPGGLVGVPGGYPGGTPGVPPGSRGDLGRYHGGYCGGYSGGSLA
jgi:hypothetical protein